MDDSCGLGGGRAVSHRFDAPQVVRRKSLVDKNLEWAPRYKLVV